MNNFTFIHTADWHADSDPKKQAKLEASLKQIVEYCINVKVNAIIHAGDVWERGQKYQLNSGVPIVLKYLHQLAKLVDFIFITKGNNSHDETGSIELLHQIEPNVYAFEYPVVLAIDGEKIENVLHYYDPHHKGDYIVSLVPYPTKANLLIEDSIDNNNSNFLEKFEQIFELIGDVTKEYHCPKILAFHGNVVGSRLSTGQTLVSQDIMVAPSSLEKAKHDYYALGHIHLRQEIKPHMIYSGSIYNKSWGETEQKSFEVLTISNEAKNNYPIPLAARPMAKLEAVFQFGEIIVDPEGEHTHDLVGDNPEYRIRITLHENERNLITESMLDNLAAVYGQDVKIEFNIVPVQRESRSEQIMECKNLIDEVREYAKITNEQINESIEKKVNEIQEVGL